MSEAPITLYVWPGQWGLPSFDPGCLATVLYLQLTVPGKFTVLECNNPDVSPSGQLPLLVHGQVTTSLFSSIVKYVKGLERSGQTDLDSALTPLERSQKTAWISHVESHFGNLVYHTFYSNAANWEKVIHPALVNMYGLPQRYYVPGRIRASFKPRLESVGLWNLPQPEPEKKTSLRAEKKGDDKKRETKQKFTQAFEREKIQEKARDILGTYARLLEGKQFVYQGRTTTLDLILAAHTLLLVSPLFPDTLIKELAEEWYTTLAEHAKRIQDIVSGSDRPELQVQSSRGSLWDLIPSRTALSTASKYKGSERTAEDVEYEKLTWGFFGLALGSVVAYVAIMGSPIRIVVEPVVEEGQDGDEEIVVGEGGVGDEEGGSGGEGEEE